MSILLAIRQACIARLQWKDLTESKIDCPLRSRMDGEYVTSITPSSLGTTMRTVHMDVVSTDELMELCDKVNPLPAHLEVVVSDGAAEKVVGPINIPVLIDDRDCAQTYVLLYEKS